MDRTLPALRPILAVPLGAPPGSLAAGVGSSPPAIAAQRLAAAMRRAFATPTSASAWRELRNPVHCYPFTLCHGGVAVPRAAPKGAHSGRRRGSFAPWRFRPAYFGSYPASQPTGGDSSHEPDRKSGAARRCGGEPARLGITRLRSEPGAGRQQLAAAD